MYFIEDGSNKLSRGGNKIYDMFHPNIINIGEVRAVDDPDYIGRIKVRVKGPRSSGGDDGLTDEELPWSFPLIPKHLSVRPNIGEAVFVMTFNLREKRHVDRLYLGPIISQPQNLEYDYIYFGGLKPFSFSSEAPNQSIDNIPEAKGVFPKPDEVSIQGRYNTDITQKRNEVIIRAGKFVTKAPTDENPTGIKFNNRTMGYIQIKNDAIITPKNDSGNAEKGTVTNIVSNKINLLTHNGGDPSFDLLNQESHIDGNLISDDELSKILKEAHQLPFGDVLLEYLKLLKNALLSHVHNGNGNVPTDLIASGNKQAVADFKSKADDLEAAMLSKNIRIN